MPAGLWNGLGASAAISLSLPTTYQNDKSQVGSH